MKEQPGSSTVVQGVATDKGGIGYSGVGYKTADVKAVPLSARQGGVCVDTNPDNAFNGSYPLARFLFLYVNKQPGAGLDPLRREFLRYVLSREGQEAVVKDGYLPMPAKLIGEERAQLGL